MSKATTILKNSLLSLSAALIFVSTIFLSNMVAVKNTALSLIIIFVAAVVYGLTLKSSTTKSVLWKWVVSLPLAYLILQYFWATHYAVRSLNWLLPRYGQSNAGGRTAGAVLLLVFTVLCIIAVGIAQYAVPKWSKRFAHIQWITALVMAVAVIVIVLVLEQQFPSYQYVITL